MTGITTSGLQTAQAIKDAAEQLFFDHGYEATSLRVVAAAVGVKVGSLYNHIDSKEELLLQVMGSTMDDLMALQADALKEIEDPVGRILTLVECHIKFHAEHARAVFIGNTELRSLSEDARLKIIRKRRDYQELIESVVIEAGNGGEASIVDPKLHAFGILAQGTHVASWYKSTGPYSMTDIIRGYSQIILRGLGVEDADARVNAHLAGANQQQ